MIRIAQFVAVSIGIIALAGALLALVFPGAESFRAILASAGIALAVQLVAFVILRQMRGRTVMIGWGVGSLLRLGALVVYALVAVRSTDLPAVPALVSLATFLFATMIVEPLLLKA